MKKLLVLFVFVCACVGTSFAQKGESALGVNLNYGNDTNLGLGLKYRYSFNDNWRIEPAFNYYFKHDYASMWDLGANLHYLCPVSESIAIYPLAGLGYAHATVYLSDLGDYWEDVSGGKVTVNLGAGVDFKVASKVKLNLEAKYQIVENTNQLVVSAGVAFAF